MALVSLMLLAVAWATPAHAVRVFSNEPQTSIPLDEALGLGTPDLPLDTAPLVRGGALAAAPTRTARPCTI